MVPFERQIYVMLIQDWVKEENARVEAQNRKR